MKRLVLLVRSILVLALVASGQLFTPIFTSSAAATGLSAVSQMVPGCALLSSGNMDCWGNYSNYGFEKTQPYLFDGGVLRPKAVGDPISQIADSCFIMSSDSSVDCANNEGLVPIGLQGAVNISKSTESELFGKACAVLVDGKIYCWNGVEASSSFSTPSQFSDVTNATQVAIGNDGGCVLLGDKSVSCWGNLTSGNSASPVAMNLGVTVKQIAVSWLSACALTESGDVWCWGDNSRGQLGRTINPSSLNSSIFESPSRVSGVASVSTIAMGDSLDQGASNRWSRETTSCAVTSYGSLSCWGSNRFSAVGDGTSSDASTPKLITMPGGSLVQLVETNGMQTCASTTEGSLYCWGSLVGPVCWNWNSCTTPHLLRLFADLPDVPLAPSLTSASAAGGQITATWTPPTGNTATISSYQVTARFTEASSSIIDLSSNNRSHCALLSDKKVACWGSDLDLWWDGTTSSFFAQGAGRFASSGAWTGDTPTVVNGVNDAKQVAVGTNFACALLENASVECWGLNNSGQLGNGSSDGALSRPYPTHGLTPVIGLSEPIVQVESGNVQGSAKICALGASGSIYCWGDGFGSAPVKQQDIAHATKITIGESVTCALISDGTVSCWGDNHYGQLGNGTNVNSSSPVQVSSLSDAVDVAAESNGACALEADGQTVCWGSNDDNGGALGNGTFNDAWTPVPVSGVPKAVKLATTAGGACAITVDEKAFCWGTAQQPPHQYDRDFIKTAKEVTDLSGSIEISGGYLMMCGVHHLDTSSAKGNVTCWGQNTFGELGVGDYRNTTVSPSEAMTTDLEVTCQSALTSCSLQIPAGALSARVQVQAFNNSGLSVASNSLVIDDLSGQSGPLTQIANTSLSGSVISGISLVAVNTDASAGVTFSVDSSNPNCSLGVSQTLNSSSVGICDVVATTSSPNPASGIPANPPGQKRQSPTVQVQSRSSTVRYLFVGQPQSTSLAIANSNLSINGSQVSLVTSGGTGNGAISFYSTDAKCLVRGSTLISTDTTTVTVCKVTARKSEDAIYDSTVSSPVTFTFTPTPTAPVAVTSQATSASSGFSFSITNYSATSSYALSVSQGKVAMGTVKGGSLPVTVTGLTAGQLAKVTVITSKTGFLNSNASVVGWAQAPTFKAAKPTLTATGFTIALSALSANYNYVPVIAGGDGVATISSTSASTANVTVSNATLGGASVRISQVAKSSDMVNGAGYVSDPTKAQTISSAVKPSISFYELGSTQANTSTAAVGDLVYVRGANLWGATAVKVGGVAATKYSVLAGGTIAVGISATMKSGAVQVTTPAGTATGGVLTITKTKLLPSSLVFSKTTGGAGTAVQLEGVNLGGATSVKLGGVSLSFQLLTSTNLEVAISASVKTGSYPFVVTTSAGTTTSIATFTVSGAQAIGSVGINNGGNLPGTSVLFTGTNLAAVKSVTVNGLNVTWAAYSPDLLLLVLPISIASGSVPTIKFVTDGGNVTFSGLTVGSP